MEQDTTAAAAAAAKGLLVVLLLVTLPLVLVRLVLLLLLPAVRAAPGATGGLGLRLRLGLRLGLGLAGGGLLHLQHLQLQLVVPAALVAGMTHAWRHVGIFFAGGPRTFQPLPGERVAGTVAACGGPGSVAAVGWSRDARGLHTCTCCVIGRSRWRRTAWALDMMRW